MFELSGGLRATLCGTSFEEDVDDDNDEIRNVVDDVRGDADWATANDAKQVTECDRIYLL